MLRNLILAAGAAGLAAGLVTAAVQHVTTTQIIIEAEQYEGGEVVGAEEDAAGASHHGAAATAEDVTPNAGDVAANTAEVPVVEEEEWAPEDGLERTFHTTLATAVIGVGFALTLLGAMVLAGVRIDSRTGLAFGAAGFIAVALAPGMGLPPEIPGSAADALENRQVWWFFAAGATAIGLAGLLLTGRTALQIGGVVLIALPHIIGAPHPETFVSTAPAELAGHFVAASLAVTAMFWGILGYASGAFYERFSRAR